MCKKGDKRRACWYFEWFFVIYRYCKLLKWFCFSQQREELQLQNSELQVKLKAKVEECSHFLNQVNELHSRLQKGDLMIQQVCMGCYIIDPFLISLNGIYICKWFGLALSDTNTANCITIWLLHWKLSCNHQVILVFLIDFSFKTSIRGEYLTG